MTNLADLELVSPRLILKPFSPEDAVESVGCITPSLTRYMAWEAASSQRRKYHQSPYRTPQLNQAETA